MGNRPSHPAAQQRSALTAKRDELFARAACAVSRADALVVFTGAGFSADSGLPIYVDVADVPAYHARGLTYSDLCTPSLLQAEPELFTGFWGGCFNAYRATEEHAGYALIAAWRAAHLSGSPLPAPFFSFTSNVDHHWRRVLPAAQLYECHGSTEMFQCAKRACAEELRADAAAGEGVDGGRWAAPPGFRFAVAEESRLAPAGEPAAPAARAVGSAQPHDGSAFAANHPACIRCGGPARPSVLFFDDEEWMENAADAARWAAFKRALLAAARARGGGGGDSDGGDGDGGGGGGGPPLRVALLEIGAGGNVTTVRRTAEALTLELAAAGASPTLIRVNPELPLADRPEARFFLLPIMEKGLAAVRGIDAALRAAAGDAWLEPREGLCLPGVPGAGGGGDA
jgi:NAD-dependent SIR2 family protein deacetylase